LWGEVALWEEYVTKGTSVAKARVHFREDGVARARSFASLPAALDFAVRLLQSKATDIGELSVSENGVIVFRREDVARLSALVRLG
jgi:hypothetical protein